MQENPNFTHNMDVLFSNLEDLTKKEAILGKPVTHGDKTLIPVMSITIGYGTGSNKSKMGSPNANQTANMGTGALGLGARVSTDAVVVIEKNNVTMLPTTQKSNLSMMIDKLPQMVSSVASNMGMGMGNQQNQQQGQQQGQQQNQQQGQQS